MDSVKLSILVPVYNERAGLPGVVERLLKLPDDCEFVFADDASTDGSLDFLHSLSDPRIRLLTSRQNQGKGTAVTRALAVAVGRYVAIQDADLEYDPSDLLRLLAAVEASSARVAYGYRDLSRQRPLLRLGNRLVTLATNLIYRANLRDMESCYKLLDRQLALELNLSARRFDIEPEITAKLLLAGEAILQLPIAYEPRYEGKKLAFWRDGPAALAALVALRWKSGKNRSAARGKNGGEN